MALFIRFNIIHYENYPKQFHLMVGAYIVILCLLYNMFLDANRNFFTRGYYQEFYYTVRYTLILVVGLVHKISITRILYVSIILFFLLIFSILLPQILTDTAFLRPVSTPRRCWSSQKIS